MADHSAAIMQSLRRIVRFLRIADREADSSHGLSAAQLFVLHSLAASPARSLAELAGRTLTDASSVSTVVAKLVAKKLVARVRSPADARKFELRLAPAGERVVRATPRIVQMRITDGIAKLTADERDKIVHALELLVRTIGADELEPRMLFDDEATVKPRGRSRASRRGSAT
jgi:DNA-binding MarR family transcriptional regulator